MKISELDEENKAKALEYQRNEVDEYYSKKTNNLQKAFKWKSTKEGLVYWECLHLKKTNKMEITKEQILKLADIAGDTGRKELEKMFPKVFGIEFDANKIYVLKTPNRTTQRLVCLGKDSYTFVPIRNTRPNAYFVLPVEKLFETEKKYITVFDTFKEYVEFLNTLI